MRRIDWGLLFVAGPRETVAVAEFSDTVRRDLVGLTNITSATGSAALVER